MIIRRPRRSVPEINSSSTADIAFLLLTFFLITTSMGTERGLPRRLPAAVVQEQPALPVKRKARNIMWLTLGADDRLCCNGDSIALSDLRARVKTFVANVDDDPELPEKSVREIPYFGRMAVTDKHIIAVQCDREASYKAYFAMQNEVVAAYNELRNELARQKWHRDYAFLSSEQQAAVRMVYPQMISESTTSQTGGHS